MHPIKHIKEIFLSHYKTNYLPPYTANIYIFIFYLSAKKVWQLAKIYINI